MVDTYQYIVNQSRDFITLINRDYRYEIVNDSYCGAIERPRGKIVNRLVAEVWGEERFTEEIKPRLDECFAGNEVHFVDQFRFGSTRKSLHISFYPYYEDLPPGGDDPEHSAGREPTHALVFSHDITYLADVEARLARYEYRDHTTGLYNRRSLEEMLSAEVERARRTSPYELRGVLFVSLHSFKKINQSFGHHIGDLLLEDTANRIREAIRSSDVVFRFDGTNLVVLLTSLARPTDAAVVAQKIADDVGVPYQYKGQVITIDTHIGISLFPEDATDADALIQRANSSSVEAEEHRLPFLFHDSVTHELAVARITTLSELHTAISTEALELYFHPILRITKYGAYIAGAEALIRWNHPERGFLPPEEFVDLAEGSRMIAAIDKWALFRTIGQLARWRATHDPLSLRERECA